MAEIKKKNKKKVHGVVESDRMQKSIKVRAERLVKHPRYGKYVRRHSTFIAHDPHDDARVGDVVEIEQTRPLSKTKRWRLVRIVRRAPVFGLESAAGAGDSSQLVP